uniref:RNA-directed DNA polymerase from mobile element jockey n=1 Tax=Lygus hesperus TaxID=30085 RepID=A0A146KQ35_LYGHE
MSPNKLEYGWPIPCLFESKLIKRKQKEITGLIKPAMNWHGHGHTRLATWNVRGLNGKEVELVEEIDKYNVPILGITETKKKGKGSEMIHDGALLLYSGVSGSERARAGVACLISKTHTNRVRDWSFINERIMYVLLDLDDKKMTALFVVYAPNEDETAEIKDMFYDQLQRSLDDAPDANIMLMGDLNGRVGQNDVSYREVIGKHGEPTRNNNGKRLLQFCQANSLIITNTKFPHRDIHKFTRVEPSRNERSIIDYIMVKKSEFPRIRDARVMRGAEIGSDHRMVVTSLSSATKPTGKTGNKKKNEKVNSYKLKVESIREKFCTRVTERADTAGTWKEERSLEKAWENFKEVILGAATEICGVKVCGGIKKKQTRWWNREIKAEVKEKKRRWQRYLSTKSTADYNSYKAQRTKVKKAVLEAKKKSWEEFGHYLEDSAENNQKLFYKALKNMRREGKDCPLKFIKDKQGKVLHKTNEIMKRWREYFSELLSGPSSNHYAEDQDQVEDDFSTPQALEEATREELPTPDDNPTMDELRSALQSMKLGKSAGHDGITPEMLKYMGPVGEEMLMKVFTIAWDTATIPKDWEVSVIVPIFKNKGDNRECSSHRGISLLSVPGKLYGRILERRLRGEIEAELHEAQCGFRPNRGTQDAIFTMRQIMEKAMEYGREVHACFIDIEKAFDRLPWPEIWLCLDQLNVPKKLTTRIKSFYSTCRNVVRTGNASSSEFLTSAGVRQGDCLSPLLFVAVMNRAIEECKGMKTYKVGNYKLNPIVINTLAYADDLVLIADSAQKLQHNLNMIIMALERRSMRVSLEKTKTMVISRQRSRHEIRAKGRVLDQVREFKYLGVMISEDGKLTNEINARVAAAGKLYQAVNSKFLRKREVTDRTKVSVYKSTYVPILTHSCESWATTSKTESRIQAAEMRYLRRVVGATRRDRIRNTTIRSSLNLEPLSGRVRRHQLSWFGHVQRMPEARYPRMALEARSEGSRPRGRRRITWADNIQTSLNQGRCTWRAASKKAQDRKEWQSFCKNLYT